MTDQSVRVFEGRYREAPAVFKHNGRYFIVSSWCTGWDPNAAEYAVSESMMGEWRVMGNPCAGTPEEVETTFRSQSTFVLPVAGRPGAFIFMADRWNKTDLADSRYVWLPIEIDGDRIAIRWRDDWDLSVFENGSTA